MKRQLATEWLEKELQNLDVDFESGIVTKPTYFERRASIVEQAKQKELGNLEDAVQNGFYFGQDIKSGLKVDFKNSKQYIEETYRIDK